jgi:hypothetical protein
MVPVANFVEAMENHWTSALGNVSSPALRKVWRQLGEAFNDQVRNHGDPTRETRWDVLQPPTGSGKSQGTAVYCSLLSRFTPEDHPGVLVVVRLKSDADTMASTINDLAGSNVAAAYHSDTKLELDIHSLWEIPVLIITHRAYEIALDLLGPHATIPSSWPLFHDFSGGHRKLVVVDESLAIVEESQAHLEGLRQTAAAIPQDVREEFPRELAALESWVQLLETMAAATKDVSMQESMYVRAAQDIDELGSDFGGLRAALKGVRFDLQTCKHDPSERARLSQVHDARLRSLQHIVAQWVYYARVENRNTLNTARLLVPDAVKGAVVLDATASSSVLYELFEHANVLAPPPRSRSYANVTLHVSRGHRVGKRYMEKNAKDLARDLVAELENCVEGRKVFVCTHKHVEPHLAVYAPNFELNVGHWGAVDGSNAWRECDVAVIFGLPYLPPTWAANTYFAMQGPQETSWLRDASLRRHGGHPDVRHALTVGQMVVSLVQAINRVRCRRVIDAYGNCPTTDVFLMLPAGELGDDVLAGVLQEMPGAVTREWGPSITRRKLKRQRYEAALEKLLANMPVGRAAVSTIRCELGIPEKTMKRIIERLRGPSSILAGILMDLGVRYEVHRVGRTQRAYFVKDWKPEGHPASQEHSLSG